MDQINVLHVEDDPQFADLISTFLHREDDRFDIRIASHPADGLEILADADVDCIVSDYDMPGQNGIEFLETVREEYPKLPFILYTGKGSEEVASEAISSGVTDYIQKESGPDHYSVLANRICNAVEAQQIARSVEQRQHRFDQILKTVPACVVQLNYDGQFVFANRRATEVLGLEQAEVSERTYNDPDWKITDLQGEPIPDAELPFRQVRDSGEPVYGYRHMIEWPDGTRKALLVNGAPLFSSGDEVEGAVFALTDITETIERDQELRETARRLDFALEATNTGVWEWDMETDEVVWSETLERLLGIEPGGFDGTFEAHETYLHPDALSEVDQAVAEALEADGRFNAEFRMVREDGEVIWVEGHGKTITDDGKRRMIGITREITERKERKQSLERQNERLDEFASLVSHDLRNPIGVANGALELARRECSTEYHDEIERALGRMDAIVEDVLTLARQGETVSERTRVHLGQFAENSWRNVDAGGATLVVEADATLAADTTRLGQLFENLFRNSIEHGGDDVTVTVGELDDGFYIEDDGPGIPEDDRDDVFDAGYSTSEDGTGFGLRIVTQAIEAHGWDIRVTDGSDGGARFEITGVEFPTA